MKGLITRLSVLGLMVTLVGVNAYGQSSGLSNSNKASAEKPVKYDPCSGQNYRGSLSSNQEAGTLKKYKARCAKVNPGLVSAYKAIENSLRAEKALPAGYSTRHANQHDFDKMVSATTSEISGIQSQVKLQRVKSINGFRGAGADVDNLVPQVGQIRLRDERYNEPINCNAPYTAMSDGTKGFLVPMHCIRRVSDGEWYDHLSNMKIHLGFDSDNPEWVIGVESSFCTKRDEGDDGTMLCLLIPKAYSELSNMQPIKMKLKSEYSFRRDIEQQREIYLAGYHPSRTMAEHGELYDSYEAGPHPPRTTRTIQMANRMLPTERSFTNGRGAALLGYDGDTLDESSGAAVLDWNFQSQQFELVGVHVQAPKDEDSKYNVSVLYPEDQFTEFTSAADQAEVN